LVIQGNRGGGTQIMNDELFGQMLDYAFLQELFVALATGNFQALGEFLKQFTEVLQENGEELPEAITGTVEALCNGVGPKEIAEKYGKELEKLNKELPDNNGMVNALLKSLENPMEN